MNMEENNEVEQLRMQVERLEEEVERLTKINVSLVAGSESLIKRNMDLYKRLDSYYNVRGFGVKDVAKLIGITQTRVAELYKKKTVYHSLEKYLDFLRLMRALRMLSEHPNYSIEAIAHEPGDFIRAKAPEADYKSWKQALDKAVVKKTYSAKWYTSFKWDVFYGDHFTVTSERQSGVSMYVPQDPATGNHAVYQQDIHRLAWYNAVWQ